MASPAESPSVDSDDAFWTPAVVTDAAGRASAEADHALEALEHLLLDRSPGLSEEEVVVVHGEAELELLEVLEGAAAAAHPALLGLEPARLGQHLGRDLLGPAPVLEGRAGAGRERRPAAAGEGEDLPQARRPVGEDREEGLVDDRQGELGLDRVPQRVGDA